MKILYHATGEKSIVFYEICVVKPLFVRIYKQNMFCQRGNENFLEAR